MLGMSISPKNMAALTKFAEAVQDYFALLDGLKRGKPKGFYEELESMLAKLANLILLVEQGDSGFDADRYKHLAMTHEQWWELAQMIREATSPETEKLVAWHDEALEEGARASALWDDLADLYREWRSGLALWREGTPESQGEAAWVWRFFYQTHWGRHLFRAMTTVNEMLYTILDE